MVLGITLINFSYCELEGKWQKDPEETFHIQKSMRQLRVMLKSTLEYSQKKRHSIT